MKERSGVCVDNDGKTGLNQWKIFRMADMESLEGILISQLVIKQ